MKRRMKDIGFLGVGFIVGVGSAVLFIGSQSQQPTPGSLNVAASGPRLAMVSFPPKSSSTNWQREVPAFEIVVPEQAIDRLDSRLLLSPSFQQSLHLIDTRRQPDITLDDLK